MNTWVIKDKIKSGLVTYSIGDSVILIRRKKRRSYPPSIKDGVVYIIDSIENDFILVRLHSSDGIGLPRHQSIKVHKTYMIPINILRDIKIENILKT